MPLWMMALAGVGVYVGYRVAKKQIEAATRPAKSQARAAQEPRDLGELKLDKKTGEYRPS